MKVVECGMDFEKALGGLLDAFDSGGIRYAVIGGFAVGIHGAPRATMDLDFLVHRDDLDALDAALTRLGYCQRYRSENVSQFAHPDAAWGTVDFIHAFRPRALAMLERASAKSVFSGARMLRVLLPEDVIGLKVQAMTNDPRREARERADIEALLELHGGTADWERIEEYFGLFERAEECVQLKRRFGE